MRYWVLLLLVLTLTACGASGSYDRDAEPTTKAVEPPPLGSLYGRVMHPSGTAASKATVGLRRWRAAEAFTTAAAGGVSCLGQTCLTGQYVEQTPEGTYSFPDDAAKSGDVSVVASYPSGAEAEVFFKKTGERQRVPDLVLWEEQPRVRQIGGLLFIRWPQQSGTARYAVHTKDNGQVSAASRATTRFVPAWQVSGELSVVATSDGTNAKFRYTAVPAKIQVAKPEQHPVQLDGRSCLQVRDRHRAVLPAGDKVEVSRDGVTFTAIPVPSPRWGVRNTLLGNDIRYVCGREVSLW
ncbi:hypothetical protein FKR81_04550 [Lentzea tibetensis]|uniref:Lipoprotein n=1 Tax=Lentzea tibetensis TaxID=2591470 RepID=A0A563EZU9_9PSEU|nr:hypothetical protein [Lentzea tibetensis]TWP53245.1 hypothetical protein FKR81_04550 [Lentzea tibetensis]